MNPADVADLDAMLDGTRITELSLTESGETITLRRRQSPRSRVGEEPRRAGPQASGRGGIPAGVTAPCPGIFLDRHPLHEDTLAPPGRVAAGAVVGLLRLGPLLVPVTAPGAGVLSGPEATPGSLVGYGTTLFRLNPEE